MIDKCLSALDSVRYDIFDAISDNKYRWGDTCHANEVLGWVPRTVPRITRLTMKAGHTKSIRPSTYGSATPRDAGLGLHILSLCASWYTHA